jgi:hypothetical protein
VAAAPPSREKCGRLRSRVWAEFAAQSAAEKPARATLKRVRELLRRKHCIVEIDEDAGILRRARTAEPFASVEELEWSFAELLATIAPFDRTRLGQLIDVREAPPRTDPAFEAVVMKHNAAVYRGFRATAILVRSAAGRLHVKRMTDASGVEAHVFVNEEEAIEFLRRPSAPVSGWRETVPHASAPVDRRATVSSKRRL